jgi:imidazolonepropionase-like amidohydrolase
MHVHQCDEFTIRAKVLEPIDILRSATSVNAEILQKSGQLGVVGKGALADLILVNGDPLADLAVFRADGGGVPLVMLGGEIVKNEL